MSKEKLPKFIIDADKATDVIEGYLKQEEKKPREFWINEHKTEVHQVGVPFLGGKDGRTEQPYIHVIEYSAYEQLKAELDKCKLDQIDFLTEHPTYKLSKELEAENEDLKAKLEKAKEALRFYAERYHWGNGCAAIDPCDTYTCELNVLRGGKRARAVLKEIEGE